MWRGEKYWDYLFTSSLINTWNAWKAVLQQRDSNCALTDFCDLMAIDNRRSSAFIDLPGCVRKSLVVCVPFCMCYYT